MRTFLKSLTLFLLLCLLLFLSACQETGEKAKPTPPPSTAPAYEKNWPLGKGEVRISLDHTKLSIAEEATLTLTTTRPEGMELVIDGKPEVSGSLVVRDERHSGTELASNGLVRESVTYRLAPFLPGEIKTPQLTVKFRPPEGSAGEPLSVTTDSITLTATSVLPESDTTPQLREPGAPVSVPDNRWMFIAAAIVIAALIAGLLWWYLRNRKQQPAPPPPPVPPHIRAREALAALLAEGILGRGEVKLFITRISDILRCYIEERFSLAAPERTTEEFLTELTSRGSFSTAHRLLLADFLSRCDLVKFAGQEATGAEAEELVEALRRFINETEPRAEAAP